MAAKLFEPLKDERKQIGCMSGFIHLFEPNHTRLPKRITNSMSLQGNSQLFRGRFEVEQTYPFHQHGQEMRSSRNSNDRLGLCTESSRASCSSSHSSSFSSVDYSKIMHPEPSSYDRILFPESPLLDRSLSHSSSSWRMKKQPFDLDDAVKDMSCGTGEESMVLKHQDTPMPLQPMEVSLESLYALGSPRPGLGFNASLCFEERNASRLVDESKANRYERIELGCYGQENWDMPDEMARLSLDSSTESSMLNSTVRTMASQRPPSIVEKLMGLEAMPGMSFITQNSDNRVVKHAERRDTNLIHKSASPVSTRMPLQVSSSIQRSSRKDSKWKNGELVMKPMSSSRILIEPAPWKQPDVCRTSSKTSVKFQQCSASSESNGFTALYSKFDGRLKDIEFQRSSKDLKTLKQMLDVVQQGGAWQIESKALSTDVTRNQNPDAGSDINLKEARRKMHQNVGVSMANGEQESSAKTLKSPIVVMKPFRLVAKSDIAASSVIRSEGGVPCLSKPQVSDSATRRRALSNTRALKDPNQQNGYQKPQINRSEKKLTRKQPTMRLPASKEKKRNSAVSVVSASPRIQPKNYDLEKKPRTATTTSHAAAKQSVSKSNHPRKSYSSGEKSQPKHSVTQQCNAQQSGFSTESKDTCGGDDTEVTSKLRLDHIDGSRSSPARKVARPMFSGIKKHKPSRISTEDTPLTNPSTIPTEQPSPVSVLDSTALRDGPSSPLIRKTASRGTAELVTHMSRQKLKQIEDLVHKLNGVSSIDKNSNSNTDFIASLCKTTNPDQRYISKILLASGFLFRDFESSGGSNTFHPHSSGHVINPELFLVLEQTKSSSSLTKDRRKLSASKSHRRLIFDSCNEILSEHLVPSSTPRNLARRKFSARRLLNDVCDRIDNLQGKNTQEGENENQEEGQDEDNMLKRILYKDMILKSDKWGNSEECIGEVVLDIERMLFKDLVKEIVNDEVVLFGLRGRAGRSCDRKLCFNKV